MKHWKSVWLSRVVVFALTLSVFSACEEAAGPEDVDPVQTSSTVESAVSQYITSNQAFQSLDALGPAIGGVLSPTASVILKPQSGFGSFRQLGTGVWEAVRDGQLRRGSSGASLMAIPDTLKGKTLVYNPALTPPGYEIHPTRTDAPANGVRFAMYAVNPLTGQPVEPVDQNEIGYFDIIDTSNFPTTINVSLIAVFGTDTLISYAVTGSASLTGITIDVTGFISNGTSQLDFTLKLSGNDTSVSATIDLSFSDVTVHIEFTEAVDGSDSSLIRLTQGGNTVVFEVTEDALDNITGTISFNGTVVALLSGTGDSPVFTNAEGGDLTAAQIEGIGDIFNAIESMLEAVEGLLDVAFILLGLGLI